MCINLVVLPVDVLLTIATPMIAICYALLLVSIATNLSVFTLVIPVVLLVMDLLLVSTMATPLMVWVVDSMDAILLAVVDAIPDVALLDALPVVVSPTVALSTVFLVSK